VKQQTRKNPKWLLNRRQCLGKRYVDKKLSIISQEQSLPRDISRPAGEGGGECLEWQLNEVTQNFKNFFVLPHINFLRDGCS